MALFPASPSNGDTTTVNGITYTFYSNQTAWVRTSSSSNDIIANTGTFSGNVTANYFIGNGSQLTGVVAVSAATVTNAAQPNITSVGTLTSLTVSGNANVGNIGATNFVGSGASLTNLNASNLSSGTIPDARISGSYTGMTNLTGSGTVDFAKFLGSASDTAAAPSFSWTGDTNTGIYQPAADQLAISTGGSQRGLFSSTGLTVTGTTTSTTFSGSGASLTLLNGSNITTGTIAAARVATLNQNTTGSAATVTNAAQPNITSVGTLTSLAVSGALTTTQITAGANTTSGTVTGNWTLTAGSRWQSTYADLAERYVSDNSYEPGTVVVIGGEQEVTIENVADSHKVAGVITTNPAYIMNAELQGNNAVEVALIGRVPCKVVGPVSKGDLLTSAEIAGYAHANNDATAGRIIGKALENFDGEMGIIEIMVGKT